MLIQAELMWREGEDVPRVTVRGVHRAGRHGASGRAAGVVVSVAEIADAERWPTLVADARGKGRGELVAEVATPVGVARLCLARDYLLDAETLARLGRAFGPNGSPARRSTRRDWRWWGELPPPCREGE